MGCRLGQVLRGWRRFLTVLRRLVRSRSWTTACWRKLPAVTEGTVRHSNNKVIKRSRDIIITMVGLYRKKKREEIDRLLVGSIGFVNPKLWWYVLWASLCSSHDCKEGVELCFGIVLFIENCTVQSTVRQCFLVGYSFGLINLDTIIAIHSEVTNYAFTVFSIQITLKRPILHD